MPASLRHSPATFSASSSLACLSLYSVAGGVLAAAALVSLYRSDMQLLPYAIAAILLWLAVGSWWLYRSLRPCKAYAQAYLLNHSSPPTTAAPAGTQAPWELYAFWGIPSTQMSGFSSALSPRNTSLPVRTAACAVTAKAQGPLQRPTSLFGAYQ